MGWETIAWCEIDPFCQLVLKKHFPDAKGHADIIQTDFSIYKGKCDLVTGGFPCQPFSVAGKRKGSEDHRHLWPFMFKAIQQIAPAYVVAENVSGLINQEGGMVFEQVCLDLETEGYEVQTFVIPACAVNAPHRRDRVWILAHSSQYGSYKSREGRPPEFIDQIGFERITADTHGDGLNGCNGQYEINPGKGGEYAQHDVEQIAVTDPECRTAGAARNSNPNEGQQPTSVQKAHQGRQSETVLHNGCHDISRDVASPNGQERERRSNHPERERETVGQQWPGVERPVTRSGEERDASDAQGVGIQRHRPAGEQEPGTHAGEGLFGSNDPGDYWRVWPTQPPLRRRNDGVSSRLVRYTDGTISRFNEAQAQNRLRTEAIKAYGNSIVPQVAYEIMKAIKIYEDGR